MSYRYTMHGVGQLGTTVAFDTDMTTSEVVMFLHKLFLGDQEDRPSLLRVVTKANVTITIEVRP